MITNIITQVAGQQQPTSVTTIIKCDRVGCDKEVTFEGSERPKALAENPWLRSYRTIHTSDGRSFGYCSDLCEVQNIETGIHNAPEPQKIATDVNPAAVAAAARAAANAKAQDAAIRDGQPAKVQLT